MSLIFTFTNDYENCRKLLLNSKLINVLKKLITKFCYVLFSDKKNITSNILKTPNVPRNICSFRGVGVILL